MNPDAYTEMAAVEDSHWWFLARRQIIHKLLSKIVKSSDSQLLEVGSGTGGNLEILSSLGKVSAMEMNPEARRLAQQKAGALATIVYGRCPDEIPFPDDTFDVICMFDVLEHIARDSECLTALKGKLRPGGKIIITVPAYQWMWGPHDDHLHHVRRYTAKSLRESLKASGFQVSRISYFNTLLFPLAAAARLKDKLLKGERAAGSSVPPKWLNTTMMRIFSLESKLLTYANLPFGVSLLAVGSVANESR